MVSPPSATHFQTIKEEEGVGALVEKGKKAFVGHEITGKTLGVIGMEAIAITIAGLLGSIIAARLLWKHFSKREKKRA